MTSFLGPAEELHPDLKDCLYQQGGYTHLKHPLVFSIFYVPELNANLNRMLRLKRDAIEKNLASGDYEAVMMYHERPYRIEALLTYKAAMPLKKYWECLAYVWTDSENLESYGVRTLRSLLTAYKGKGREAMMQPDERAAFAKLPEKVKVYHGYDPKGKPQPFSWSTDKKVATWFAKRFGCKGWVKSGTVARKDIWAYLTRRNEDEALIDPRRVTITNDAPAR